MKINVYIRDALKGLLISLIIYIVITIAFTIKMAQNTSKYKLTEIITYNLFGSPFNILFFLPVFCFLVLNIIYLLLFIISTINGVRCTAEIISFENKRSLLDPRSIKHRIVVRTPDGFIGKSFRYYINLTKFHECFPESMCRIIKWRNMVFITDFR